MPPLAAGLCVPGMGVTQTGGNSPVGKPDMEMKRLPAEANCGWATDRRKQGHQRGRASITGLGLWSGKLIETERLVVVVTARLVLLVFELVERSRLSIDIADQTYASLRT
jgi:hypothetical protein